MSALPTACVEWEPEQDGWLAWCECEDGRFFESKLLAERWKTEHLDGHRQQIWRQLVTEVQEAEKNGHLDGLNDRYRDLLKARGYFGDRNQVSVRAVADRMGLTPARIYQIERNALSTIRDLAQRQHRRAASG